MDHLFYTKSPFTKFSAKHPSVASTYVVTSFNNLHLFQSYVTILRCSLGARLDCCPTNACFFHLRTNSVHEETSSRVYIYLSTFAQPRTSSYYTKQFSDRYPAFPEAVPSVPRRSPQRARSSKFCNSATPQRN